MTPTVGIDAELPPESAGRLAVKSMLIGSADEPIGAVRHRLLRQRYEIVDVVVTLYDEQKYVGVADMRDVLVADESTCLGALVRANWPTVSTETDRKHAAEAASSAGIGTLLVLAADGYFFGCIPPASMMSVLANEHREDLHRLAGILAETRGAVHALEDPPLRRTIRKHPVRAAGRT